MIYPCSVSNLVWLNPTINCYIAVWMIYHTEFRCLNPPVLKEDTRVEYNRCPKETILFLAT